MWKSKFRRAESIRWKRFLIGCRARNGYYDECPKYSLTSLNGGECQILRSSIDEKCSNSWSETVNCRYKIVDVTLMMNVNLAAQIHLIPDISVRYVDAYSPERLSNGDKLNR